MTNNKAVIHFSVLDSKTIPGKKAIEVSTSSQALDVKRVHLSKDNVEPKEAWPLIREHIIEIANSLGQVQT